MAATGVATIVEGAVAGMPAPTDRMAGDGAGLAMAALARCGSCHGSDGSRGTSGGCRRRHAGSHRWNGWRWQDCLTVGAAMAATGVAALVEGAVAGMPAPTDCMAGDGAGLAMAALAHCGSCHGSDRSRGRSGGCRRRHAGSHRLHGWRWRRAGDGSTCSVWELPWQRQESRQEWRVPSPTCRLPQMEWLAMAAVPHCGSCHGSDRTRGRSGGCRRRHAGSHRLHGWRWRRAGDGSTCPVWELPWQRQESRH